ncbi:hypothetical protein SARC_09136 [Sphaeroforma arctica JP610]|uniref:Uncharacterized protein n=1 Tax=Sphaeroforma arctica JP610 TaxID=667725 RepID=A0A0L0FPJ7_9EUKA|nr:hypothetical protein SARC_09136 [Sphaeroforma arctica JP610]KNC78436.1 hypothetical protein SARC_09136 [Sphaeroforma arctica JP610]|eukprot:XP_014152338.1 hypothetical protein SARC_09136 [Sphaeroforma arctica JP610]
MDLDMNMFETTNEISGIFTPTMLESDSARIIHQDTTNNYQGVMRDLSGRVDTATLLPDIVLDTELHNYSLPTSGRHSPVVHSDIKAKMNNNKMNDVKSFILPSSRPQRAAAWKVVDKAHGTMQKLKKAGIDTNEKWQTGLKNVVPKVHLETVRDIILTLKLGTKQSHSDYIPALAALLYFKFCSSELPLTLDEWRGKVRNVYENNVIELQREKCLQQYCSRTDDTRSTGSLG